jgi:hypothetical protein
MRGIIYSNFLVSEAEGPTPLITLSATGYNDSKPLHLSWILTISLPSIHVNVLLPAHTCFSTSSPLKSCNHFWGCFILPIRTNSSSLAWQPYWVLASLRSFCQLKYPAIASSDFVTRVFPGWGCQPHAQPPAILEGRCFLSGLSPLAD